MKAGFYIWNGLKERFSFGYYGKNKSSWGALPSYHGIRRIRSIHDPEKWVPFGGLKCLMVLLDKI